MRSHGFQDGTLEVWAGHQMPDLYQAVSAQIMGIEPAKVKLHVMTPGGFFGRRAVADADVIVEVVSVLKATGAKAPIKVQWTREDDMTGGRYRPMYFHKLTGGLDAGGRLVAWQQRIVGQSILAGTPFERMMVKDSVDPTSVEGAATLPYAVPNVLVDLVTTDVKVPVLWWRSVGSTHTAYSTEVFVDELADAAGRDPVEFRRELLEDHPRHLGVLSLVADKAGWGTPLPEGRFRGVAVHESFNTYVAQVAEISLGDDGGIKVERVVCAVDCGIAVNPDIVRAQMEGGIGFGLGAILKSEITLEGGQVAGDQLRPLPDADDRRDAQGRGPHRALDRSADRGRRAGRAADRSGARERGVRRDRQAGAGAAVQPPRVRHRLRRSGPARAPAGPASALPRIHAGGLGGADAA